MITIKHKTTGKVLVTIDAKSLTGANLTEADLTEADLSGANLFKADLSGANLREANLIKANLISANLIRADLFKADLSGANLTGADLSNADLRKADLRGANLSFCKGIYSFTLGQHFGFVYFYKQRRIVIGCIDKTCTEWLETWESEGNQHNYSEYKKLYGQMIKFFCSIELPGFENK